MIIEWKNMEYKLIEKRNKIIKEIWGKYKNDLSMKEMAEILNMELPTLYRILAENKGRQEYKNKSLK
uniref:Uncharacterized protein n=1 Tax=viral metagenome TaxID=1070528 RepID=A0A6M3KXU4_9ZZZZ